MGIVSDRLNLKHLSKDSFIALCEYVMEALPDGNIVCAQKEPVTNQHIEIHPDYFFDIPLSGQKHLCYGTGNALEEVILKPGDMLFCRPYTWKQCKWDLPHEMTCFIYKEDFIRITYVDIPEPLDTEIYPKCSCYFHTQLPPTDAINHLLKSLANLSEEAHCQEAIADIHRGLMKLTLQVLRNDFSKHITQSEITFHRIQQYLHDNYHAYINRKYISHVFNIHPGHISRLYNEFSSKSFFETLNSLRIERAAILLKNTSQNISTIAGNCGYESIPSFTTAFKKAMGVPPGMYRKIQQEKRLHS